MQQGELLIQRPEQWEQALALYTELIARQPNFAELYNKRATVRLLFDLLFALLAPFPPMCLRPDVPSVHCMRACVRPCRSSTSCSATTPRWWTAA